MNLEDKNGQLTRILYKCTTTASEKWLMQEWLLNLMNQYGWTGTEMSAVNPMHMDAKLPTSLYSQICVSVEMRWVATCQ